jgi:putative DNA primase/helicase
MPRDGETFGDFADHIGTIARRILGKPNPALSTRDQLRFGTNGSVAVEIAGEKKGTWYDHEHGEGGGVLDLLRLRLGLVDGAALDWLRRELDFGTKPPDGATGRRIVATYDYQDANDTLVFQVVRFEPKDFRQRRPNGKGGWEWSVKGIKPIPYRLPELLTASPLDPIHIVEGEKDADALHRAGLVATCNPGGAGKWRKHLADYFKDRCIVILPDNDDAGREHAHAVAANLHGVAESVRILDLPDLPKKGDVSDWLARGGTTEHLAELREQAPPFEPATGTGEGEAKPAEPAPEADDSLPSEDAVAREFARRYAETLRYCHTAQCWFLWTGTHWEQDGTQAAYAFARDLIRESNSDAKPKLQAITGRWSYASGVEKHARTIQSLTVTGKVWDTDPWLLGTPRGTVNLRTGEPRKARQGDYISRITSVPPAPPGTDCPLWKAFLKQVTKDDVALVGFLQRWCGYGLTGEAREHKLVFIHGRGRNGKGVFARAIKGIMGAYYRKAAMDTFTADGASRHKTFVAMLAGARVVMAEETEESRAWAESLIKAVTGGDDITANFMHRDAFTFIPGFKLTITGNHKPILRNVDDAIKARFLIVPFLYRPPVEDRNLDDKLRKEWPAILRWAIDGCLAWQRDGLQPPPVVAKASAEYFQSQDAFAQWLDECCVLHGVTP